MTLHCRLTIPALPVGPNGRKGLLRMYWTRRRQYFEHWAWMIAAARIESGHFPHVEKGEIKIHQYRKRLLDIDNLYASCKPCIDGLVKCGVIVDDSPDRFTLTVTQEKGAGTYTVIEVWGN